MKRIFDKTFEHRDALLNAALQEFGEKGYRQASINTMLKNAGMSKGQFYYYFESKEDLYFALIATLIERKRAYLADAMKDKALPANVFDTFQQQIHLGLEFATRYPFVNRFAESFAREQGNAIYARALKRFNFENDGFINGLIERAYIAGELRTDLPLPFIQQLIAYLFTHAVEICGLAGAKSVEANLQHFIAFMRAGLTCSAPAVKATKGGRHVGRN
jgi:AcrR family transcriptional regulator